MTQPILVRGARQLLTLHGPSGARRGEAMGRLGIIPDGALLIADGTIQDVGPARRVENLSAARNAVEISADGKVVMPGFVDAHTEPACGPPQLDSYEAGAFSSEEENGSSSPQSRTTRRLEMEARSALRQFVRHGTTTVEARSGGGRDVSTALKTLRALGKLRDRPITLLPSFCWSEDAADEAATELLSRLHRRRLAEALEVRFEGTGLASARKLLGCARGMGFRSAVSFRTANRGAVELALSEGASAVHCLGEISDAEIDLLAASDVVPTVLPGLAFHQRLGRYPPARRLIDAGTALAIATGFSSQLCPTCSMPAVLSIACAEMDLTPAEAVTASTINPAHSLGISDRVGSLEAGKDADLVLFNAGDYREIPYHFGMNLVAMSMKRGEVIYPHVESP